MNLWPVILVVVIAAIAMLFSGNEAEYRTFLAENEAMETVKAVLEQSAVLSKEFGPITYPADIEANFHDARCVGNAGDYTTCEFKLKLTGGGGRSPTKKFKLRNGKSHKFASKFRVADVAVSVDVKRQCAACAPVTIRTISLDLQASKTWGNVGKDAAKSAASTAAVNALTLGLHLLIAGDSKKWEPSVVIQNTKTWLRVQIFPGYDGDGDGTVDDSGGWNKIEYEHASLIQGGDVLSMIVLSKHSRSF